MWRSNPERNVLVVGGRGFIGSHLALRWADIDIQTGNDARDGIPMQWDAIVFLACNQERTNKALLYNRQLYQALDQYMERYPQTHIVYTSSAAVYRDSDQPLSEHDFTGPANSYGQSKLLGELHVQQYRNHTILRLANVTSDGDGSGAYDLFLGGHRTIFGLGRDIRDYVSVGTVKRAIEAAIADPIKWRGITNVSSGIGTRTIELFHELQPGLEPIFTAPRKGDVRCSILDNTKLKGLLKW